MGSLVVDPFFWYWLMIMGFAILSQVTPEQIANAFNSVFGGEKRTAKLNFFEFNLAVDAYIDLKDYKNMRFVGFWQPHSVEYDGQGNPFYWFKVKASNPGLGLDVIEDVRSDQLVPANFEALLSRPGARWQVVSNSETALGFLREQIRMEAQKKNWYKGQYKELLNDIESWSKQRGKWADEMGKMVGKNLVLSQPKHGEGVKIEVASKEQAPEDEGGTAG